MSEMPSRRQVTRLGRVYNPGAPRDISYAQDFGVRLAMLRESYGVKIGRPHLTRREFAIILKVALPRYCRWERGEIECGFAALTRLREITGCSLDTLVAGLPPGSDTLVRLYKGTEAVRPGDRLRMVREILEPSRIKVAAMLQVEDTIYGGWETGMIALPEEHMRVFCHAFGDRNGFGLDFIYRGVMGAINKDLLAAMLGRNEELQAQYPDLWRRVRDRMRHRAAAAAAGTPEDRPPQEADAPADNDDDPEDDRDGDNGNPPGNTDLRAMSR